MSLLDLCLAVNNQPSITCLNSWLIELSTLSLEVLGFPPSDRVCPLLTRISARQQHIAINYGSKSLAASRQQQYIIWEKLPSATFRLTQIVILFNPSVLLALGLKTLSLSALDPQVTSLTSFQSVMSITINSVQSGLISSFQPSAQLLQDLNVNISLSCPILVIAYSGPAFPMIRNQTSSFLNCEIQNIIWLNNSKPPMKTL